MKKLIPIIIIIIALAIAIPLAVYSPQSDIPTEPTTIVTEPTTAPFVPSPTAPKPLPSEWEVLYQYGIISLGFEMVDTNLTINITWTNQTETTAAFNELYWFVPSQNETILATSSTPILEAVDTYETDVFSLTFTMIDTATPIMISIGNVGDDAALATIEFAPNAAG